MPRFHIKRKLEEKKKVRKTIPPKKKVRKTIPPKKKVRKTITILKRAKRKTRKTTTKRGGGPTKKAARAAERRTKFVQDKNKINKKKNKNTSHRPLKELVRSGKTHEVKKLDLVVKSKTECCGHLCPVCLNVIEGDERWAYYNTCGHCLCGDCHNQMWIQNPHNVLCPICRTRWDTSQPVFCPQMVLGDSTIPEDGGTIPEDGGTID